MNNTVKKQRIYFLDYLKAVCVIMVIITHYEWSDKTTPFFTMLINMAVPLFMIISGYNFAMSNFWKIKAKDRRTESQKAEYQKAEDQKAEDQKAEDQKAENLKTEDIEVENIKETQKLKIMYAWDVIKPKLIRFLLPFLFVCVLEIIFLAFENKDIHPLRIFLLGAYGPGSYYVPIMVQLLFIFPLIYLMVERSAKWGILISGLANLVFEIVVQYSCMDVYYYRVCIGRYLLLIALGCYLYLHPERRVRKREMLAMFLVGFSYLIAVYEFNTEFALFNYWKTTAMPVAFYIFPIVILMFRSFYHLTLPGFVGNLLMKIGQSSYHIFLVQMVYYHFELGGKLMYSQWYIAVPFNVLISVSVGILFYMLDTSFRKEAGNVYRRYRWS